MLDYIKKLEGQIGEMTKEWEGIRMLEPVKNKELLKNLKIKLSNYDIYKQRTKCRYCLEYQCNCADFSGSNRQVPTECPDRSEPETRPGVGTMEQICGTTGNDNDNTVGIEFPF
jgi:hypothetical protein